MRREHLCVAAACGFSFGDLTVQQEREGTAMLYGAVYFSGLLVAFVPLDMSPGLCFGVQFHGLENSFSFN